MKIYLKDNVYEAAINRFEWIYNEFPNVVVSVSGGKDSTVIFHLALEVATRMNRLPIKVMFIDQEAEWQAAIDQIKYFMYHPDVEPYWLQVPFKMTNSTSMFDQWLYAWKEGDDWIRPKDPVALTENVYGVDRFEQMFKGFMDYTFKNEPACNIGGVRCEESPMRLVAMTVALTYKHVTWGKAHNKDKHHYAFYPIYDWRLTDVWKYIHDNGHQYCKIYDYMYQHGVPIHDMRVSNLHHETALRNLFILQEIEPETWDAIQRRLSGINTTGRYGWEFLRVMDLPEMFKDWVEYRDHLLKHLIINEHQNKFRKTFDRMEIRYKNMKHKNDMYKRQISSILINDYEFVKLRNWESSPLVAGFVEWDKHRKQGKSFFKNKYIHG